jgi:uncharacterized membrane protein YqjE
MNGERDPATMSSGELIKNVLGQASELVKTQIALATTEIKADLRAELKAGIGLAVAAVAGFAAFILLLVTAVFALALVMPGWLAALLVFALLALVALIAGVTGWKKRVTKPLARTRHEIKEDVRWTKERIA